MGARPRAFPMIMARCGTTRHLALALALALAPGCRRESDTPRPALPTDAATAVDAGPTPTPADAAYDASLEDATRSTGIDAAVSDPYASLPPLESDGRILVSQRFVGFTKDDRYLGYEISVCDPCPPQFHFTGPGVPPLDLKYLWEPGQDDELAEGRRKKNDDEVDRRLKDLGVVHAEGGRTLRGPFPHPDLAFATTTTRDDETGKVTLLFGARIGDAPPVYPMRVVLGPHPMFEPVPDVRRSLDKMTPAERAVELRKWHEQFQMYDPILAYANLTKNGKDIGIVVIAGGNGWHETGGVLRMPVARFIAAIRAGSDAGR